MDYNYSPSAKQAIYFIPDISGFSQFVENTAIEHSIHIISELLEILLDNNVPKHLLVFWLSDNSIINEAAKYCKRK